MWDACGLSLDKFAQKRELDVVGHDVWWTLNFALLHEQLQVGHDFVLELLQPFMQLHVILVGASITVNLKNGVHVNTTRG